MRIARRVATAIAILLFGPLLGMVAGGLLGAFSLAPGYADGGRAPGDGFLIILCIAAGLFVSFPLSAAKAGVMLFRQLGTPDRKMGNSQRPIAPD